MCVSVGTTLKGGLHGEISEQGMCVSLGTTLKGDCMGKSPNRTCVLV